MTVILGKCNYTLITLTKSIITTNVAILVAITNLRFNPNDENLNRFCTIFTLNMYIEQDYT